MVIKIGVNIGSGNGLLPDGTKPLPEPMVEQLSMGPVAFPWEQFHGKCSVFSAANLALVGFPLANALGENMPSCY